VVDVQVLDAQPRAVEVLGNHPPPGISPFRLALLALGVERRLLPADEHPGRREQPDARLGEALLERGEDGVLLARDGILALIEGAEAARKEPVAVHLHGPKYAPPRAPSGAIRGSSRDVPTWAHFGAPLRSGT